MREFPKLLHTYYMNVSTCRLFESLVGAVLESRIL